MKIQDSEIKNQKKVRKEVEDYYKSWVHKSFQKGVKDARVILCDHAIVIIGSEFLSFVEQSILDDEYSKQVVSYTRKKVAQKNFPVLKKNIENIVERQVEVCYMDFSVENNTSCMTLLLGKGVESCETIKKV